jgi:Rrf2 family protein
MLRLSKRVEYGLVALQHLAKASAVSTVREMSDEYGISYDLLAKIMQDLKKDGMIYSHQGVRGGYALMLNPASITLSRVVDALEDDTTLIHCSSAASESDPCPREATCTIKSPMQRLQSKLEETMNSVTIAQLL